MRCTPLKSDGETGLLRWPFCNDRSLTIAMAMLSLRSLQNVSPQQLIVCHDFPGTYNAF